MPNLPLKSRLRCSLCPEACSAVLQVLSNGVECRLQRNALAVLEPPTGNETVSVSFDTM